MGPGALWLERTERETEEQPQLVIDALEIEPARRSPISAPARLLQLPHRAAGRADGKVLAIDIEPAMLEVIAQRASREHVDNVATIRSSRAIRTSRPAASTCCSWSTSTTSSNIPTR